MIRTPLRPLARILDAREKGENPDVIEKENLAIRHEAMRDRDRVRAERRLFVLGFAFFMAFTVIGARMGTLAASEPAEPRASVSGSQITAQRSATTVQHREMMRWKRSIWSSCSREICESVCARDWSKTRSPAPSNNLWPKCLWPIC